MNNNDNYHLKRIFFAEAVVLYFALLTLISYARGPVHYVPMGETPFRQCTDFYVFEDTGGVSSIDGEVIDIQNPESGTFGVCTRIPLNDLQGIIVETSADCRSAGNPSLHFDLLWDDYDSDEQEAVLPMHQGTTEIEIELDKGKNAPEQALLRVFTLDKAELQLRNLTVWKAEPLPRIPLPVVVVTMIAAILLTGTALRILFRKGHTDEREGTGNVKKK